MRVAAALIYVNDRGVLAHDCFESHGESLSLLSQSFITLPAQHVDLVWPSLLDSQLFVVVKQGGSLNANSELSSELLTPF